LGEAEPSSAAVAVVVVAVATLEAEVAAEAAVVDLEAEWDLWRAPLQTPMQCKLILNSTSPSRLRIQLPKLLLRHQRLYFPNYSD
jgi:hypothetical protein